MVGLTGPGGSTLLLITAFVQQSPSSNLYRGNGPILLPQQQLPLSVLARRGGAQQQQPRISTSAQGAAANAVVTTLLDPAAKAAAISFFNGIRVPATLIAGTSLAGLFTLAKDVRDTSGMTKLKIVLLRTYHVLSLFSLCLSLTSVLTSTTATTLLLLSKHQIVASVVPTTRAAAAGNESMDVYHFLRSSMDFEFVYTRWAFLLSIVCFLSSTTVRMLLEFDLDKPKRRLAGWCVLSTMGGVISFILSYANMTQNCWPSLWAMTKDIVLVRDTP
jgi:hypothetical protein